MKTRRLVPLLWIAVSAACLEGATISILKDVQFSVGAPQIISQDLGGSVFAIGGGAAKQLIITETRSGGKIIAAFGPGYPGSYPEFFVRRISSSGGTEWTRSIGGTNSIHMLYDVVENDAMEIVVLAGIAGSEFLRNRAAPRIVKLSRTGDIIEDHTPAGDPSGRRFYFFSRITPNAGGYILAGKSQEQLSCPPCWSVVVRRMALDFTVEWEARVPSMTYTRFDDELDVTHLKRTGDGEFVYVLSQGQVVKARGDGSIEWIAGYGNWCINAPCYERPVGILRPQHGGHALLYTSFNNPTNTGNRTAPNYGLSDYWFVRIRDNGQQQWDRSFGGVLQEDALFATQTEDGGFIVGGRTESDTISGNKGVVGRGTWCLKLNSSGVKEAEFLIPGEYWTILPKVSGYSLVGWGTNCCSTLVNVDLDAHHRILVSTRATTMNPYNLDVSADLVTWTPLVIGFVGDLDLKEPLGPSHKFYRVVEP